MKKIIPYTVFICLVVMYGCNQETKTTPVSNNMPDPVSNNEKNIKDFFAAFNAHDWQKVASFYVDTPQFLDPSMGIDFVMLSHAKIMEKHQQLESYFPDLTDSLTGIYPSGDKVITEFIATGTYKNGKKLKLPICDVFTFKNGKIISDATYYDQSK